MNIDHNCVSMEETDNGGSVSASPGDSRKGSIESSGEVVAAEIAEKKADSEDDAPVRDKETREGGGNSSSDGVTEREQLLQQLANCKKQIQVKKKEILLIEEVYFVNTNKYAVNLFTCSSL